MQFPFDLAERVHAADIREAIAIISSPQGSDALNSLWASLSSSSTDPREASNAAWILTHLPARFAPWLSERRGEMTDILLKTSSDTLRRLLISMLAKMPWAEGDLRADLLDLCLANMTDRHVPLGIRAQSIYLAAKMCATVPELAHEFAVTRDVLASSDDALQPAIRSALRHTAKLKVRK